MDKRNTRAIDIISSDRQFYDGHTWIKNKKTGYYYTCFKGKGISKNKGLHQYVWEKYNGGIKEGCEIHHKDHNKNNNEIHNLECVERNKHRRQHQLEKVGYKGVFEGNCIFCGEKLSSTKQWGVFCTTKCKQAYARKQQRYKETRICELCGKEYKTDKYKATKVCQKCGAKRGYNTLLVTKGIESICPYCHGKFIGVHGAKHCQKRECKNAHLRYLRKVKKESTRGGEE